VLSHGKANEQRDRKAKLKLYSRRGVQEYWIVSWIEQFVEIYRRDDAELKLAANLNAQAELESSLLPGFSCQVAKLFLSSRPA
jgi:Uma2 family endonuclease